MPSRKQRRRREKSRRHDYEFVYVDEEGREVHADAGELQSSKAKKADRNTGRGAATTRRSRTVEPPSWRRVLRRGLLFGPLMFLTVYLLSPRFTLIQKVAQTLVLLAFFLPFSYFMDALMYRAFRKRVGGSGGPATGS
jgi:hypothetical protein